MLPIRSLRLALGLLACALVCVFQPAVFAQADKKLPTKNITIPTFDGVQLNGTLHLNPGAKRDAIVVLVHHFDTKKGGSSQSEEWTNLAAALYRDGYSVLSFDFRGFGESKSVNKETFWTFSHNKNLVTKKKGDMESITFTQFRPSYYPYLVNDLAAVKAYLDRRNDEKEVNSANIIVVAAGDGAAVSSMWMAHEARRRRDKSGGLGMVTLADPEIKDVAAAVFISPTTAIGPKGTGQYMTKWVIDAGKSHKVPMAFVYAKSDGTSDTVSGTLFRALKPMGSKGKDLPNTGIEKIDGTKLKGAALLDKELGTANWIVSTYLKKVMEDRGAKERIERSPEKAIYYYTSSATQSKPVKINKKPGEEIGPVDITTFLPTALAP